MTIQYSRISMDNDRNTRLTEGRLVCWQGSSKKIYGIIRRVDGELRVFVDDTHSFQIKDIISSMVVVK